MNKKNIVQILTWSIVISALILNFWWFLWWNNQDKWEKINPLEITIFEDLDSRFLKILVDSSWMTVDEIETEMNNNRGKSISSILKDKGIEINLPTRERR